jgi:hypothetical protein
MVVKSHRDDVKSLIDLIRALEQGGYNQGHSNPLKEKIRRQVRGSDWNITGFIEAIFDDNFYFRVEKSARDWSGYMRFDRVKQCQRHLIMEGAYFHVKTKMTPYGMKSLVNMIEPRRLTPAEIEERSQRIKELVIWWDEIRKDQDENLKNNK